MSAARVCDLVVYSGGRVPAAQVEYFLDITVLGVTVGQLASSTWAASESVAGATGRHEVVEGLSRPSFCSRSVSGSTSCWPTKDIGTSGLKRPARRHVLFRSWAIILACRRITKMRRSPKERLTASQGGDSPRKWQRHAVDPGDVEHVLSNLTLPPLERLQQSFRRARLGRPSGK